MGPKRTRSCVRVPEVRGPCFSLTPSRLKEVPSADGTSVLAEDFHGELFRQHVGGLVVGRDFLDSDLASQRGREWW